MMNLLILLVVVFAIVAILRLMKVYELTAELRGETEEEVKEKDIRWNAAMMIGALVFIFGFCIFQLVKYSHVILPESASEHGVSVDLLMNFNLIIITIVFVVTNFVLFYFASKYYFRKGNKATFVSHNNKLEMIWTIIPAIVLTVIIIYGLTTWNKITKPYAENDAVKIELYAKQFDWTARYAGKDNTLGSFDYRLTSDTNPLALISEDKANDDDILVKGEFHIPVGREVDFNFRSRDIIHSAYMPHFRAQMNCVPGMITNFHFKPIITTAEMRKKLNNPDFNYILLCNKICGAAHYNMQMDIIVETQEEYNKWLAEQKTYAMTNAPVKEEAKEVKAAEVKTDTLTAKKDTVKLAIK